MDITNKILKLIKEKGITRKKFLEDLNLTKNTFSNWNNRGTIPNGKVIKSIAEYFDVSINYLIGSSISAEINHELNIDNTLIELYEAWKLLSKENKQNVLNFAKFLKINDENNI